MSKFSNFLILLFLVCDAYAQQAPIMVCNAAGTSCTPYKNLDTAIIAANPGSYLYLPGGDFSISVYINKELHIVGAGHYPDSTLVTGRTQITGDIRLQTNSSNSSFEGLYLFGIIANYCSSDTINNIKVVKVNLDGMSYVSGANYFNNCLLKDCIIRSNCTPKFIGTTITNTVICGAIDFLIYSEVANCIVYSVMVWDYSIVKNNIFDSTSTVGGGCIGCQLINNVTVYSSLASSGGSGAAVESGTLANVPYGSLYVSATTKGFNYTKNYHLKTSCLGHNAGTDGTDVGIYGGSMPYSEGAVPGNPHFMYKHVDGTTNSSGSLPVDIKVRTGH